MTPAPHLRHQDVVLELAYQLRAYTKQAGGKVFGSPVDVMLTRSDVVEPELLERGDTLHSPLLPGFALSVNELFDL